MEKAAAKEIDLSEDILRLHNMLSSKRAEKHWTTSIIIKAISYMYIGDKQLTGQFTFPEPKKPTLFF